MDFIKKNYNSTSVYEFTSVDETCKILFSFSDDVGKEYYLSSIRFHYVIDFDNKYYEDLVIQGSNLRKKIEFIEGMDIAPMNYLNQVACGRVFVLIQKPNSINSCLTFLSECVQSFVLIKNLTPILQPDYDQFEIKNELGKCLKIPSFILNHSPTAYSTVVSFNTLLNETSTQHPSIGVCGAGNLGKEIIGLLRHENPNCKIYFTDSNILKKELFSEADNVQWIDLNSFYSLNYDAIIYCANHGSLTPEALSKIYEMSNILCVGGPEAGLDSNLDAIKSLEERNIQFIPSRLCGSLGLICNLQETLDVPYDFAHLQTKFSEFIDTKVKNCLAEEITLAESCSNLNLIKSTQIRHTDSTLQLEAA